MPIVFNNRSLLLPALGPRYNIPARGVGDISVVGRSWVFKPESHPFGNISLGAGLKLPTGNWRYKDVYPDLTGGNFQRKPAVTPFNLPGDHGVGVIVDSQIFKVLRHPKLRGIGLFASGTYLINPRDVNRAASQIATLGAGGLPTVQNALINSVPDSYTVIAGISLPPKGIKNDIIRAFRWNPTYRWEGVRQTDMFGRSDGFRIPGMTMAIDPGASWVYKNNIVTVNCPIVFFRRIDSNLAQLPGSPFRTLGSVAPAYLILRYTRIF